MTNSLLGVASPGADSSRPGTRVVPSRYQFVPSLGFPADVEKGLTLVMELKVVAELGIDLCVQILLPAFAPFSQRSVRSRS